MRAVLLTALSVLTIACGNGRGRFAFAIADHSNLPVLEQKFFHPQRFVRERQVPVFETDDVLWYAYQPRSPQTGVHYGISLQKKSLGYQEIDLRNRTIADGQGMLIDNYRNLEPGEYRLKIAYANKVIDQVDFIIVTDSASESTDFETDEVEETTGEDSPMALLGSP